MGSVGTEPSNSDVAYHQLYANVIRMSIASTINASVLSVRVSAAERALLQDAAEQAQTSLSDFVRRKAIEAAGAEILSRTSVTIPAERWEAFEEWVSRPPMAVPAFRELARHKPTWER